MALSLSLSLSREMELDTTLKWRDMDSMPDKLVSHFYFIWLAKK